MPGPQLKQAIPFSKKVKALFPEVIIIWGGYFASNQSGVVLNAGYVDYVVYGPGDKTFPQLLQLLQRNEGKVEAIKQVNNLIFKDGEQIIKTAKDELYDQDELPPLPYQNWIHFIRSKIPGQNLSRQSYHRLSLQYWLSV